MQNKKVNTNNHSQIPTFNIRKIFKKNSSSRNPQEYPQYTPEYESEKYSEIFNNFTNPKKEKQLIIDRSVNEAILNSKAYTDLKKVYSEGKKKNLQKKKQVEQQIEKLKRQKQEALQEQERLEQEKQKYQEMIILMRKRIMDVRQRNKQARQMLQSRISNEAQYLSNLIMSMRFQAQYEHNIDPDQMTYEQLLQLQQKIGSVSRGLPLEVIQSLPKSKITEFDEQNKCTICFSSFELEQISTNLSPCKHAFHFECVSSWLKKEKICPLCKQELQFDARPQNEEE